MEDHLKKLVEYAKPQPKNLIVLSGEGSRLKTSFNPPLEYPTSCQFEMSLLRLETYYSFPNIDSTNNCVRISIDNGNTWIMIKIPVGCYEIEAMNNEIQRVIMEKTTEKEKEKQIVFSSNPNTLKCILDIKGAKAQVDFNIENSLNKVVGFNAKTYTKGRYESEHLVNIMNVNSILVHCDVIGASRVNGREEPVIYSFFPDAAPGDKIISEPKHLIYVPLTMNIISYMTAWLTDQTGKALDLRGEALTLTFHVRKIH